MKLSNTMTVCKISARRERPAIALVKTALLTAVLLAGVTTDALAAGSISGRVTSATTTFGLANAGVQFYDLVADNGTFVAPTTTDASGNYTANLPAGTYAVVTQAIDGYINKIYNNIPCSAVCDTNALTAVVVTNGAVTGIDFALELGGRITGTVTSAATHSPIAGVRVNFMDPNGQLFFTSALTDASGNYISDGGTTTGNIYAATGNTQGYQDEVYNNVHCGDCDIKLVGNPIPVTLAGGASSIDFALDLGGRITGTVRNASNAPLPNVEVRFWDSIGNKVGAVLTDGSGNYASNGLAAGNYFASTQHTPGVVEQVYNNLPCPGGFCNVTVGTPIPVIIGGTASGRDFVLAPGGIISGTVTNVGGGAPIQGVFVALFQTSTTPGPTFGQTLFVGGANTNSLGMYSVIAPPGTYFAGIVDQASFANQIYNGLPCVTGNCPVQNGTAINVSTGATTGNVNFALQASGSISGTVTGAVVSGVGVQAFTSAGVGVGSGNTNGLGVYTLTGLAPGSYYVRTNSGGAVINQLYNGVVCVNCAVATSGGTLIAVTANTTTSGIDFALTGGGRISGTITGGGGPLQGVAAQLFGPTGVAMGNYNTNASGAYTTFAVPPGSYFVRTGVTAAQNFIDQLWLGVTCVPCVITSGTPIVVAGTATTTGINFGLSGGGSISGTTTNAAGGALVSGIPILVWDSTGLLVKNVTTGASGNYTVTGLPNGNYFVGTNQNSGQNFVRQVYNGFPFTGTVTTGTPVDVTVGATHTGVDFAMSSGGTLTGTVTGAAAVPLAGVTVVAYSPAGKAVRTGTTGVTGSYAVPGLPAGTYYVSTSVGITPLPFYVDELYDNLPCLGCVTAPFLPIVTLPCALPCAPTVTTGTPVVVTNGTTQTGVDFSLATGAGVISGLVRDTLSSNGLANVQVSIYNAAGVLVKSVLSAINNGAYNVRGLAPGTYYARTVVSPATPYYTDVAFGNAACAPCNVVTTSSPITVVANTATNAVNFSLPTGGSIAGLVTDAATTNPLASVDVQLFNATGTLVKTTFSGSTGAFTLDGLPPGTYYARTAVPASPSSYVDELYDNIPCVSCVVTTGTVIVVTNGATHGGVNFALLPTVPTVVTTAATSIGQFGAMLNGMVNPNGSSTTATLQYGLTISYGSQVTVSPAPGSGMSPVAVSAAIAGLSCYTPYHFRAAATNGGGPANGADAIFTTAACGPTIAPIPNVVTRTNAPNAVSITVASTAGSGAITLSGSSSNPTLVPNANLVFSGSGASRTLTIAPAANRKGVTTITVNASDSTGAAHTSFVLLVGIPQAGDFDGDGSSEIGVFRPTNGAWYIRGATVATTFGGSGDTPVGRDYDGDGQADIAVFRPATGVWYIWQSSTQTGLSYTWGGAGDIAVPADYDGDGKTDIAVFRPLTGVWYIWQSATQTGITYTWGGGADIPAPRDYDGDGKTDIAVFRPATGEWLIWQSKTQTGITYTWGGGDDIPVPNDFDGDGQTDIAVFRPLTGDWFIWQSATQTGIAYTWGGGSDIPVPGDYDGDGKTDIAVFRPLTGEWFVWQSGTQTGFSTIWGGGGDIPILKRP